MRKKTCCVTGHRNLPQREINYVKAALRREIDRAAADGYTCFISGFGEGVEQYFAEGAFDIYIYSDFDEMLLENVLTEMFSYGIGAQRSVGKGGFRIEGRVERFGGFQYPSNPDSFVALSNFVPARDDPTDGSYKAFVKYPKVSYTENTEDSPFKKPILFLRAGSIFRTKPVKEIYGSCVENIALKDGTVSDRIIIGAYTIAVPCCLGYV